jgi:hypothetical protein
MSDGANRDAKVDRNVPFDDLRTHYRNHVTWPALAAAGILLIAGLLMFLRFFDGHDYDSRRALQLLYGFTFLLGLVAIWSVVLSMLVGFAEAEIRLMNDVGVRETSAEPASLVKEIGDLSVPDAIALDTGDIQKLQSLAAIAAAGGTAGGGTRSLPTPAGAGASVVLRGFYDAASKLPDPRFLLVSFVILLIIALALDSTYDLPNLTIDITSPGTPTPADTLVPTQTPPAVVGTPVGAVAHPAGIASVDRAASIAVAAWSPIRAATAA